MILKYYYSIKISIITVRGGSPSIQKINKKTLEVFLKLEGGQDVDTSKVSIKINL